MRYHAVIVPETGDPFIRSYDTMAEMAGFLKGQPDTSQGFVLFGERVDVTEGPFRYLSFHEALVPLFVDPRPGRKDRGPSLGRWSVRDEPMPPGDASYDALIRQAAEPAVVEPVLDDIPDA